MALSEESIRTLKRSTSEARLQDSQIHEDSDHGIANYERVTLKSSKGLQMDFLIQKETLISNFNKEDTICGK